MFASATPAVCASRTDVAALGQPSFAVTSPVLSVPRDGDLEVVLLIMSATAAIVLLPSALTAASDVEVTLAGKETVTAVGVGAGAAAWGTVTSAVVEASLPLNTFQRTSTTAAPISHGSQREPDLVAVVAAEEVLASGAGAAARTSGRTLRHHGCLTTRPEGRGRLANPTSPAIRLSSAPCSLGAWLAAATPATSH